jgi:S1-C subfamily serine protease
VVAGALAGALVAALVLISGIAATDDQPAAPSAATAVPTSTSSLAANRVQQVLAKVSPSVVTIHTNTSSGEAAGTGVIYDTSGLVITNAHVVEGAQKIEVDLSDGTTAAADLVGAAKEADVAVLRMQNPPGNLVPAELGSSAQLAVGQEVVAIGNSLNLGEQPSVTLGIVSAKNRSITAPTGALLPGLIQTDAAINPGNSGGPLVDLGGRVVGINTAIVEGAQSVGFSLGIDTVLPLVKDLAAGLAPQVVTPKLGVQVRDIVTVDPAVLQQYGISEQTGAFVEAVQPDTGAENAGVQPGDVIVSIEGHKVRSAADVGRLVNEKRPGDQVKFTVRRQGKDIDSVATLTNG